MPDQDRLEQLLRQIDGSPYPRYRQLVGRWQLGEDEVIVDHVQGDPFAAPSRMRLRRQTDLPDHLLHDRDARHAAEDWLLRRFADELRWQSRGSGKSGRIDVYRPGPEVLERSGLRLDHRGVAEVRLWVGLPARGRRVLGRQAYEIFTGDLPRAMQALEQADGLEEHAHSVVVQRELRRGLGARGLVAFVANGSVLPRMSGVDQRPLDQAVPFQSPMSLEVELQTSAGPIRGMGIREGVSVIIGGGFHGKSTLLQALQRGHLDHVPGDGRERVVALPDTVKVRAEDGRRVTGVDISAFLRDLPGGRSTAPFFTDDASGSTSQAAAISEALESGARLLLLDEDTSATNLLVRDQRMRQLIPAEREPIIPLVERVQQLHDDRGVSTIMVVGGICDYLAAADVVIAMQDYRPTDATQAAREVVPEVPVPPGPLPVPAARIPLRDGLQPDKVRARSEQRISYGGQDLELSAVEQILDRAHAATLGDALRFMHDELVDGRRSLPSVLDALDAILDDEGPEALSPWDSPTGNLIRPRRHEVAAALNRLRTLQIRTSDPG